MKPQDYIRAWKDPDFRDGLSAEQHAALPEHPCEGIELSDEALELVAGAGTNQVGTAGCCGDTSGGTGCLTWCLCTLGTWETSCPPTQSPGVPA